MDMLCADQICFGAENTLLLEDVSFRVPKGSFVGLIGPNGSGKTTLLKTIYRAHKAKSGSVYLDGRDLSSLSGKQIARTMAVVAQENQVNFDFSVLEVLMIGRYAHRSFLDSRREEDLRLCEAALEAVGMLHLRNRSFLSLSGGEKQKVLIAAAFAREPELIVLDEPTNHLDVGYQFLILDLMKQRRDVTVLTSMHDMNMAMQYCDYLIALKEGKVYCTGTPREVLTRETLGELFHVKAEVREMPDGMPYIRYLGAV